jgi:hypothetical protein
LKQKRRRRRRRRRTTTTTIAYENNIQTSQKMCYEGLREIENDEKRRT